jgi:hypothetical protein
MFIRPAFPPRSASELLVLLQSLYLVALVSVAGTRA